MDLGDLLKELRLMKGQQDYRFCLAWIAVLVHVMMRPAVFAFVIWAFATLDARENTGKAVAYLLPILKKALNQYLEVS